MAEIKNVLQVVSSTKILGKEINLYGSIENPLFYSKDVAEWIEERDGFTLARKVDESEKLLHTICVGGQNREVVMLTEDGLYEACMKSRKPIAKEMKKEGKNYLKSIRLTGAAIADGREMEMIRNYFPSFSEETKMQMLDDLLQAKRDYDFLINTEGLWHSNMVAKELGIGRNKLLEYLREKKVLFYQDGVNVPYQRFMDEDKFKIKESICADGNYRPVTYATKKGLDYIRKLLVKDGFYVKEA